MKNYLLAIALILASTSAIAERLVTSTGLESTLDGTQVSACTNAKRNALQSSGGNEVVVAYSRCDCGKNRDNQWTCSVDAKIAKSGATAERLNTAMGLESPSDGTQVSACADAKRNATRGMSSDEREAGYSRCECEKNRDKQWTCSVDARITKK